MTIWAWPLRAAAVSLLALASACADTGSKTVAQAGTGTQRSCFRNADVTSWADVDRSTINLRVNVSDYYQIKLLAPCGDIDFNQSIGLRAGGGSDFICDALGVDVIARTPIGRETCPVTSLRRLTPDEVKALPGRQKP